MKLRLEQEATNIITKTCDSSEGHQNLQKTTKKKTKTKTLAVHSSSTYAIYLWTYIILPIVEMK